MSVLTFLFTDIEGSTRRWEADADAMRAALESHNLSLRDAVNTHGGNAFNYTGDGMCAVFESPRAAEIAGHGQLTRSPMCVAQDTRPRLSGTRKTGRPWPWGGRSRCAGSSQRTLDGNHRMASGRDEADIIITDPIHAVRP